MATEMIQHSVEFRKYATRNLNDDVLIEHIQKIMNEVNEKVNSVWRADLLHEENSTRWFREIFINATGQGPRYYSVFIQLSGPNGVNADIQADELIAMMAKRGTIIKGEKWLIHSVDGTDYKPLTDDEKAMRLAERTGSLVTYADIKMPEDWKPYFGGLIGIDAQLRVIMKRVQRAIEFDFQHRFHGLLIGPPGCGKSTTLEAHKRMFGDEAVMVLDGAAVTSSGIAKLIEELADLGRMPRFIFIEEIEKASNDATTILLGLMDQRGEIRKTTNKGNVVRDCRAVVFATANNWEKLQSMQSGALASRFGPPIVYTRPSDDMMRQILMANLKPVGLDTHKNASKWIDSTLDWCHKVDNLDPRYAISVCMNGQDDLLNGTYQADLEATMFKNTDGGMVINFD